jgi:FkbH-like protein
MLLDDWGVHVVRLMSRVVPAPMWERFMMNFSDPAGGLQQADFGQRFRLSTTATLTNVGTHCVCTDLVSLRRLVLPTEVAEHFEKLRDKPMTRPEFIAWSSLGPAGDRIFRLLREYGLIVAEDADEQEVLRQLVSGATAASDPTVGGQAGWPERRYWQPCPLELSDFAGRSRQTVRGLLIGGCVMQFAQESLLAEGARSGLDMELRHRWPDQWPELVGLVTRWDPELTVWQTGVQPLLTALWDGGPFTSAATRGRRVRSMSRYLRNQIDFLGQVLGSRLGLVHSFGPPAVSPFGPADRSVESGFAEVIGGLNQVIREAVARHANLRLIDEELLAIRYGAENLFDDLIFPYGHHGGRPDPAIEEPNQTPLLSLALSREYVNAFRLYYGVKKVKCVIADLDGVLWPGIAAEDGFDWVDSDSTSRWMHLGLHQALRLVKERGIHLVTCSKNNEAPTLDGWEKAADRHPELLAPADFIMHRINWEAKSENIVDVCRRLGLTADSVAFLDDNPVERAEVRAHSPGVQVVDMPVHQFREHLLTDAGYAVAEITQEARNRFSTTQAMLARDDLASSMPQEDFLRDLRVEVSVQPATVGDVPRIVELLNRTTQCTTTARRTTGADAARLIRAPGCDVLIMTVADRFANYGVVGVLVCEHDVVTALAVSCRVVGLSVVVPFLVTALRRTGRARAGIQGLLTRTDRNEPAWRLFRDAGFREQDAETFVLADPADLVALNGIPQQVRWRELQPD